MFCTFQAGIMDNKLLCPTLSMMLVKTIKALCEINIHYDQKLEITGSLHVRSDGNKVCRVTWYMHQKSCSN